MAEINDLNINDASNTARFPEGQAPSTVNNGARALEGLIARWHKDTNASVVTTGTGSAYVYAANQTLLAYYDGLLLGVDFHATCGAAPTLNADALGAINLKWPNGTALAAGDVVAGQKALIVYDSTGPDFVVLTAGGSAAARSVGAAAGNLPAANQPFTDIASASTTAIGGVNSLNVRITGTTTITSFGTIDDGIFRRVRFAGALTLTHNATSLILKGGANILTAANDTADFVSLGSGNWFCVDYQRASGAPVSPQITLGTEQATTSGTAITFTGIPAGVRRVSVMLIGISTTGTSFPMIQFGTSGGFETSGYIGAVSRVSAGSQASSTFASGFYLQAGWTGTTVLSGVITFTIESISNNRWAASGAFGMSDLSDASFCGGYKALSSALTQLRLTTILGTDTFDLGEMNISYE